MTGAHNSYKGIHELDIFTPGFRGKPFITPKGNRFDVVVETNKVLINTPTKHHFLAFFNPTSEDPSYSFSVNNLGTTKSRHSELYPKKLVKRSMDYFQLVSGVQIERVTCSWLMDPSASDNFAEYQHNLSSAGDNPTFEQQAEAAQNTWSGRLLSRRLGFVVVQSVIAITPGTLEVRFRKPH